MLHTLSQQVGELQTVYAHADPADKPRFNFKSTSLINANSNQKSGCSSVHPDPDYPLYR